MGANVVDATVNVDDIGSGSGAAVVARIVDIGVVATLVESNADGVVDVTGTVEANMFSI